MAKIDGGGGAMKGGWVGCCLAAEGGTAEWEWGVSFFVWAGAKRRQGVWGVFEILMIYM